MQKTTHQKHTDIKQESYPKTVHGIIESRHGVFLSLPGYESYFRARERAAEAGGRLATLHDIIRELRDNDKFRTIVGFESFWIEGWQPPKSTTRCRIDYEKCILTPVSNRGWNSLDVKERAYVFHPSGSKQSTISIGISSQRELDIMAGREEHLAARVIVFIDPEKQGSDKQKPVLDSTPKLRR